MPVTSRPSPARGNGRTLGHAPHTSMPGPAGAWLGSGPHPLMALCGGWSGRPALLRPGDTTVAFLAHSSILWPGYAATANSPGCAPLHVTRLMASTATSSTSRGRLPPVADGAPRWHGRLVDQTPGTMSRVISLDFTGMLPVVAASPVGAYTRSTRPLSRSQNLELASAGETACRVPPVPTLCHELEEL